VTKADFYRGKTVAAVEWWVCSCSLPQLAWARLRVFSDGSADVCWSEGTKLYGFDERRFASYYLSEDEYTSFTGWDVEDEQLYGIRAADIQVPSWIDQPEQEFKYFGTY
jgi:hypothetical protein